MKKIPKPKYATEFRELAVKRVTEGASPGAAAKELVGRANVAQLGQSGRGKQAQWRRRQGCNAGADRAIPIAQ